MKASPCLKIHLKINVSHSLLGVTFSPSKFFPKVFSRKSGESLTKAAGVTTFVIQASVQCVFTKQRHNVGKVGVAGASSSGRESTERAVSGLGLHG